jgi:hypothetical protein
MATKKSKPTKRKKKMSPTVCEVPYKESISVPANKLKTARVGKKATFTVTGKVIGEDINRYDNNKRSFRVEIDKVKSSIPKPKRR